MENIASVFLSSRKANCAVQLLHVLNIIELEVM